MGLFLPFFAFFCFFSFAKEKKGEEIVFKGIPP